MNDSGNVWKTNSRMLFPRSKSWFLVICEIFSGALYVLLLLMVYMNGTFSDILFMTLNTSSSKFLRKFCMTIFLVHVFCAIVLMLMMDRKKSFFWVWGSAYPPPSVRKEVFGLS